MNAVSEVSVFALKALERRTLLSASYVCRHVSASSADVASSLFALEKEGVLKRVHELCCYSCGEVLDRKFSKAELQDAYSCLCGERIEKIRETLASEKSPSFLCIKFSRGDV